MDRAEITDEMRATALLSALRQVESHCQMEGDSHLPLAAWLERALSLARPRGLEPRLYELCWWLQKTGFGLPH
jgi:hypothetical protein